MSCGKILSVPKSGPAPRHPPRSAPRRTRLVRPAAAGSARSRRRPATRSRARSLLRAFRSAFARRRPAAPHAISRRSSISDLRPQPVHLHLLEERVGDARHRRRARTHRRQSSPAPQPGSCPAARAAQTTAPARPRSTIRPVTTSLSSFCASGPRKPEQRARREIVEGHFSPCHSREPRESSMPGRIRARQTWRTTTRSSRTAPSPTTTASTKPMSPLATAASPPSAILSGRHR